jgi:hypothetical protein
VLNRGRTWSFKEVRLRVTPKVMGVDEGGIRLQTNNIAGLARMLHKFEVLERKKNYDLRGRYTYTI